MSSNHITSASKLEILLRCPGSAALGRIVEESSTYAEDGTAGHSYMEKLGNGWLKSTALAEAPEHMRARLSAIKHEKFFGERTGLATEQAMVYNVFDGNTRTGTREELYSNTSWWDVPGTADLLSPGYVGDYKFGTRKVNRPKRNAQLLLLALAARASFVYDLAWTLEIIYVEENGELTIEWDTVTHAELDAFADYLEATFSKVEKYRKKEIPLEVRPGEHCTYCPSKLFCPAHVQALKVASNSPERFTGELALTPENAADAYHKLKAVRRIMVSAEAQLAAYAKENSIDLGDGTTYGPSSMRRETLDADIAHSVLLKIHGPEIAHRAMDLSTSKAAIERALKEGYPDIPASRLLRDVVSAIRSEGGVITKTHTTLKVLRDKETTHSLPE